MSDELKIDLDRVTICGTRLLVRVLDPHDVSPGGIIIPDASQKERCVAEIVKRGSVGDFAEVVPGEWPAYFQVGHHVIVGRYALRGEQEMQEFGKGLRIIESKDVLAVIRPEETTP